MLQVWNNLRIGKKLAFLIGGFLLQLAALVLATVWGMGLVKSASDDAMREAKLTATTNDAVSHVTSVVVHVGLLTLSKPPYTKLQDRIANLRKEYLTHFQEIAQAIETPEDKAQFEKLRSAVDRFRAVNLRVIELVDAGKQAEGQDIYRAKTMPAFEVVDDEMEKFVRMREKSLALHEEERDRVQSRIVWMLGIFCVVTVAFGSIIGVATSKSITGSMSITVGNLKEISAGNLNVHVDDAIKARGDEVGDIARAVDVMKTSMRNAFKEVTEGIHVISQSSGQLLEASKKISAGSKQASERAHAVAAASEQMSANSTSVAGEMDLTTSSLSEISTSTSQMTATINEIAGNSERARVITEEVSRRATQITEQMNELGDAAQKIGKVTETINEISSQTNLLALNATIEAARAGAAGKGFAVVANEVKELAQQAAQATEDIRTRIAGVQDSTERGIEEISKISGVIGEVTEIVASIATAIEEQAAVMSGVAQSISQASTNVEHANGQVAQSSQASQEIAQEIAGVDHAAREMAEGTEHIRGRATELSTLAVNLSQVVGRFRV